MSNNDRLEDALSVLQEHLVGRLIDRIGRGDTWDLRFDNDLWLVTHELQSPQQSGIDDLLRAADPAVLEAVDPEDVGLAAVLASLMRRPVKGVALSASCELSLTFDEYRSITTRTDVDIVDWYWSLGPQPSTPYHSPPLVACFARGSIHIGEPGE